MSDGRTIWMPKDTGWWRREHVVELGEEFGPVGPSVLDWLSCEAKLQNDEGRVKAGPKTLARGVFSDAVTVGHVLSRAVQLGALHGFKEHDGRFSCVISGWLSDNTRGRDAWRQADNRAKSKAAVTVGHGESRSVTESPQREEERREDPPTPQRGEHVDFLSWLEHHEQTTGMKPPKEGTAARKNVASAFAARRSEGYDLADLCAATVGAYEDEHRRQNGYFSPESVLRPTKVHGLIEKGRMARKPKPGRNDRAGKVTLLGATQHCKRCGTEIGNVQANNQWGLCDTHYADRVAELEGAA